jgi:uncharacterized protein with FMN-binding domain
VVWRQFFGASQPGPLDTSSGSSSVDQTQSQTQQQPSQTGGNTQQTQTGYKDGQYTGNLVDAFYGNLQVKAIVSGGKLADVQFLTYPDHAGHTSEVSSMALPILRSEAIANQRAQVNVVSGATQTSQAFMMSLGSALAQAGGSSVNIQVSPPREMF